MIKVDLEEVKERQNHLALKGFTELLNKYAKPHNIKVPEIPSFEADEKKIDQFWFNLASCMVQLNTKLDQNEKKEVLEAAITIRITAESEYVN